MWAMLPVALESLRCYFALVPLVPLDFQVSCNSVSRTDREPGELLSGKQSEKKPMFRNSLVLPRRVEENIPARQIAQGQDVGI